MKRTGIIAMALALFSGCAQNGYLGDGSLRENPGCAISFNGKSAPVTRTVSGADAAALLGGGFVVYGSKSNGSSYSTVFDGYNVKWAGANPGETLGNTWEYVGQQTLDNQVQGVKYWDYNTQHYTFIAFSKGGGYANFSDVNPANIGTDRPIYTIKGQPNDDQLYPLYLAEPVQVNKANYGKEPVSISFRPFRTKARFGIYETIPGYSVENVSFYHSSSIESPGGNHPTIITDDDFLPNMGEFEYSVYSSGIGDRLSVQCVPKQGVQYKHNVYFDTLAYSSDGMLGTTSASASYFQDSLGNSYINVLPTGDNSGKLGIRVDFTLVPLDGSDSHKITVRGAMAYIPEEFIRWQPGYAYTYLFKISDAVDGLYPITFDAQEYLASDPLDAETIEGEISITTYQKGSAMEDSGAYNTTDNIYVTVGNYLTLNYRWPQDAGFVRLYYATGTQKISEQTVENCLKNGVYDNVNHSMSITDAAGNTLSLTNVSQNMSIRYNYDEDDYPNPSWKDSIKSNGIACISNQKAGTYVFVYDPSSYSSNHIFCTLPKGGEYYTYEVDESEDGNAYHMNYFKADGTEQYDPDLTVVSDLGIDYMNCVSDSGYNDDWYIQGSKILPAGFSFYFPIEADGRIYYGQYISVGTERLDVGAVAERGAYRLKRSVYFENYEPGYTIESGEPYFEVSEVLYSRDGNEYTGYARGDEYPVLITEDNMYSYVYLIKNQEKITEYPSGDGVFPFEKMNEDNNTKLCVGEWYFVIDGVDSYRDDDGSYDDGTSIYVKEYQADGSEYSVMARLSAEYGVIHDGYDYGLYYDNCDDVGSYSYYPTFLNEDNYCTLSAGGHYCYFEDDNTKRTYIANGMESPYYDFPTDNGLFIDNLDSRPCIKIIEVR